jgi:hypothetical protein
MHVAEFRLRLWIVGSSILVPTSGHFSCSAFSQRHQRFVDGNAQQSGRELRIPFKLLNLCIRFAQGVL